MEVSMDFLPRSNTSTCMTFTKPDTCQILLRPTVSHMALLASPHGCLLGTPPYVDRSLRGRAVLVVDRAFVGTFCCPRTLSITKQQQEGQRQQDTFRRGWMVRSSTVRSYVRYALTAQPLRRLSFCDRRQFETNMFPLVPFYELSCPV